MERYFSWRRTTETGRASKHLSEEREALFHFCLCKSADKIATRRARLQFTRNFLTIFDISHRAEGSPAIQRVYQLLYATVYC